MTIYLSLLVAILGAVLYVLAKNVRAEELGRVAFGAGLLAFLLRFAQDAALRLPS